MGEQNSRRDFLKVPASALLIAAPGIVSGYQANAALSVGLIGAGRRGTYVSGIFAKNEFAKIAAVCDIYDDQLAEATRLFSGARTFKNYNELLASDVDAVYIATPPYLHPEHFEAAVKARKHIFCEKPAGVDAAGCRRVLAAARQADPSKRISFDFQQRYGREYLKAYDLVKSGELGAIRMVRAAWLGAALPVREGHPQDQDSMRNWLYYRERSGDMIIEQDCHNLDVVNWFLGTHPVRANGYGGRALRTFGTSMDNLSADFRFADGLVFSYSANQFPGTYREVGEIFFGEKGTLRTSRQGYELFPLKGPSTIVKTDYDITRDAVNAFVDGARTGKIENAAFTAVESTLTAIMAREAIYAGKEMGWEQFG